MTDAEIVKTIAEKVMGMIRHGDIWMIDGRSYALEHKGDPTVAFLFSPLDDNNDCMAAWVKMESSKLLKNNSGSWSATVSIGSGREIESYSSAWCSTHRRAMCVCMVKAVKKNPELSC